MSHVGPRRRTTPLRSRRRTPSPSTRKRISSERNTENDKTSSDVPTREELLLQIIQTQKEQLSDFRRQMKRIVKDQASGVLECSQKEVVLLLKENEELNQVINQKTEV